MLVSSFSIQVDGPSRKHGRPKWTWIEVVWTLLNNCNLLMDLALDSSEWRNRNYVANLNMVGTRL